MTVNAPGLKMCGRCKQEKPATLDYFSRGNKPGLLQPLCKDCLRACAKEGRAVQLAQHTTQRVRVFNQDTLRCSRCDTAKPRDAFADQKGSSTGKQKWCKDCHRDYRTSRLIRQSVPNEIPPSLPVPEDRPTVVATPRSTDAPAFLRVGTHTFSHFAAIIEDDRGRADIILPVAETDVRTGHAAPLTMSFTAEEWAARRIVTMTDIVNGGRVDLFERVTELERDNDRLRKEAARERADKEAAMALAEESAQKLARFRAAAAAL
jgi:hypothetical protein